MKVVAFGWMNCDPDVFFRMRMKDFLLKAEGFWERLKYDQQIIRRLAYITHASMSPKPLTPQRLWPMDGEEKKLTKEDLKERGMAVERRLRMMQAIQDEKAKKN
jgi:hypothetical protein